MHIDFVLPEEGDIEKGLASYRAKAALGCMDFGFHVAVTTWNDKVAADLESAVAQGINSFKFFLAYKVWRCLPRVSRLHPLPAT
jgi:dihydropyrimidinase